MTRGSPDGDDRAVSNTVGFVFVFSYLVIAFTIYQGFAIPEQNKHVEFDHNQRVQDKIQDVRNAIRNTVTGSETSVSVRLGADYPERLIALNLASSTGTLETSSAGSGIVIENASAVDGETRDYVGGSSTTIGPLASKALRYEPGYTRYDDAPTTVYENTVVYNRYESGRNLSLTGQTIVDGRTVTLIALNGSLSTTKATSLSVDPEGLSVSSERIALTNASSGRINVTIPTRLSAANWSDILSDQLDTVGTDDRYVVAVRDTGANEVSILLEAGVTYDLRLAKVGVGTETRGEKAHYVTDVSGNGTSVAEGGTRKVVVEVRDRFNNPLSNVTVESEITASAGSGDTVTPGTATTDSRGRASFIYTAPGNVDSAGSAEITVFFDARTPARQNVTFDVTVLDADGSGATSCSNDPGTGYEVSWCASNPATRVSQPGGVISGIGSATHINLSEPMFSSIQPGDGRMLADSERFRLAFVLEKDRADRSGTTRYMFVVPDTNAGFAQTLNDATVSVQNRNIIVYKDAAVNDDGSGYTTFVDGQLTQGDLANWYKGTLTLDLLDDVHYTGNPSSQLDEIESFVRNNDVRIYIVDMDGRVTISVA